MSRLTKKIIESSPLKAKPYFIFDTSIKGFCVRITPTGNRTYYVQYIKNKKVKRFAIGNHGIITCENARDKAIKLLASIKDNFDPQHDKQQKNNELTLSELSQRFMDEHVKLRCKKTTQINYNLTLNKHILPKIGHLKITEITRKDVADLHHKLHHSIYTANRSLEVISKMFNLAEMWGLRPDHSNPCKHLKKYPEKRRERYLKKEEALRLGNILDEMKRYPDENISAIYCIQLTLLTGCRVGEIRTLKWEYIDNENYAFNLPDSKTGAKIVYVGNVVISLIEEIKNHPARPSNNPYVIWGREDGSCLYNIQKPWRRFRKLADLDDLRIHDLRHSFASFAISSGMSLEIIGKLLGHKVVQTTARYAHLMAEPMKEAASSVSNELGNLINVTPVNINEELKLSSQQKIALENKTHHTLPKSNIVTPIYLNTKQAASYLNIPPRLLENWRWRKTGPEYIKVGNSVRYKIDALKNWIKISI